MKHNGVYPFLEVVYSELINYFLKGIPVYQMSIFCVKMFKNSAKFCKKSAKLQAIANKHLNILTYLTNMSKIGENL